MSYWDSFYSYQLKTTLSIFFTNTTKSGYYRSCKIQLIHYRSIVNTFYLF